MNNSPHFALREYPIAPDFEMSLRIILGRGIFERSSFKNFMRHTIERHVAIDVGAHVGSWTVGLSRLFEQVICFEPEPGNRACLEKNLRRAHADNVTVYADAVQNNIGAAFGITANNITRNSGQAHLVLMSEAGGRVTPVRCVRLDDVIPSSTRVNALKVDVEGLELAVVKSGGERLIREHKPTILLEVRDFHMRYGAKPDDIFCHMRSIGYRAIGRYRHDYVFIPR